MTRRYNTGDSVVSPQKILKNVAAKFTNKYLKWWKYLEGKVESQSRECWEWRRDWLRGHLMKRAAKSVCSPVIMSIIAQTFLTFLFLSPRVLGKTDNLINSVKSSYSNVLKQESLALTMLQRNFLGASRFLMIRRSRLYCSMRTSHTRPRRWTFTSPSPWERWARCRTASRPCRSRCTSRCPGLTTGCQWSTNTRPGVRAPQVGPTSIGNSNPFVPNKMIKIFTLEDSSFFVTQLSQPYV